MRSSKEFIASQTGSLISLVYRIKRKSDFIANHINAYTLIKKVVCPVPMLDHMIDY